MASPETKYDVGFQLINRDQEQTHLALTLIVILSYMIVFDGLCDQRNHHPKSTTCLVVMSMDQVNSAKTEWKVTTGEYAQTVLTYEVTKLPLIYRC